jgi:hypothetical protein
LQVAETYLQHSNKFILWEIAFMASTTREQRRELAIEGFFRADGLPIYDGMSPQNCGVIRRPMTDNPYGYRDFDRGIMVLYPEKTDEVWIAYGRHDNTFLRSICPIWGTTVPCNRGEHILAWMIIRRLSEPNWMPLEDGTPVALATASAG